MITSNQNIGSLSCLPRVPLCDIKTPIEHMKNLSRIIGGGLLYVKRDDCNGLAFGGNKVRQLEFYFGEAINNGCDTIMMTGAVQSNFIRTAAAACRKLGLNCHAQLEERVDKHDLEYRNNGNVLLNNLLGATLYSFPEGENEAGADRRLEEIAQDLTKQGHSPYIVPMSPDHKPLGALGYIIAAQELLEQINEMKINIDEIVVAAGSGNTYAGLLFGLRALGSHIKVIGICVRRDAKQQYSRMQTRFEQIADLLDMEQLVPDEDIHLIDDYLSPGYGLANEDVYDAMSLGAHYEALILDPCYMGKTTAGLLDRACEGKEEKKNILMFHTGGSPALFGYADELRLKDKNKSNKWNIPNKY